MFRTRKSYFICSLGRLKCVAWRNMRVAETKKATTTQIPAMYVLSCLSAREPAIGAASGCAVNILLSYFC